MQEGATFTEGTNHAICKLWPPLTTCRPGIAWKPPASTLAHRLAVIHPDIRMRWPERLGAKPVPSTADVRTSTPACAPHPANGVRKDQQQWLSLAGELPQTLDLFVGRAKGLDRITPRCCGAQPNRLTVFELLIKAPTVSSRSNLFKYQEHASSCRVDNPQTNKKDQRSKTYLAEISKLSTKVHGAS